MPGPLTGTRQREKSLFLPPNGGQGIEEYPGNVRIPFYAKKEVYIKPHTAAAKLQIAASGKGDHMNKWKTLVLSLLICCLAVAASGTLAYYTASEQAHNVITSGGIDIALQEYADAGDALVPFEDVDGVMPGMEVSKIVCVENTGASEAWIRVSVVKDIEFAQPVDREPDLALLVLDIDEENWTEQDGYYYYNRALRPGETTEPLFTTVTFAETMGNEYQNSTAAIDVTADAVQTANNGETALDAVGWPAA